MISAQNHQERLNGNKKMEHDSSIQIEIDGDNPDSLLRDESEFISNRRLNQRFTLLAILLPCLFSAILLVGYLNIKQDIAKIQENESQYVSNLSKDVDTRLNHLSGKIGVLENDTQKKLIELDKLIGVYKANIKQYDTELKNLKSSTPGKKDLSEGISKLQKALEPIQNNQKNIAETVEKLNQKYVADLTTLNKVVNSVFKDIEKLQAGISILSASKLDKKVLDLALIANQKEYNNKINESINPIRKSLLPINDKLNKLETEVKKLSATPAKKPQLTPADKTTPPSPKSGKKIKRGDIIEQDLTQ